MGQAVSLVLFRVVLWIVLPKERRSTNSHKETRKETGLTELKLV